MDIMMTPYPKRFGDSGPEWIIDLESQDGNLYKLLKAIEKVMGEEKYAIEALNGEHYSDIDNCPYNGYERVLDYILTMIPDIELRYHGQEIQQVYPCYHDSAKKTTHVSRGNFC